MTAPTAKRKKVNRPPTAHAVTVHHGTVLAAEAWSYVQVRDREVYVQVRLADQTILMRFRVPR